jgi:hypothetical protein
MVSEEFKERPRCWVNDLKLEFLHIPKTGGTSLQEMLKQVNRDIIHYKNLRKMHGYIPDGSSKPRDNHEDSDFIHAPITGFNTGHKLVYPTNRLFFTFLRDPKEIALSYIKMAQNNNTNPYHSLANNDLGKMIETCCEIKNSMTWRLAGLDQNTLNKYRKIAAQEMIEVAEIAQTLEINSLKKSQTIDVSALEKISSIDRRTIEENINHHDIIHNGDAYTNNVTESTYEIALANLKYFYFVGLFENYQKDVQRLVNKIYKNYNLEKYTRKVDIPHLNKSINKNLALDPAFKEKLIANNKYDIMLYEYARQNT